MPKGRYRSRGIARISAQRLEEQVTRKIVRDKDGNIVRVEVIPNKGIRKVPPSVLSEFNL